MKFSERLKFRNKKLTSSPKKGQFKSVEFGPELLILYRRKNDEKIEVYRGTDCFCYQQSETGTRVEEVCCKLGISEATFYNWKKKYGSLRVSELRKLRQLEEENAQLKKLVADLSLDKQMLQDVLKKSIEAFPAS